MPCYSIIYFFPSFICCLFANPSPVYSLIYWTPYNLSFLTPNLHHHSLLIHIHLKQLLFYYKLLYSAAASTTWTTNERDFTQFLHLQNYSDIALLRVVAWMRKSIKRKKLKLLSENPLKLLPIKECFYARIYEKWQKWRFGRRNRRRRLENSSELENSGGSKKNIFHVISIKDRDWYQLYPISIILHTG